MMNAYKGYTGTLELDQEEAIFHGRVIGITDVVTYEGKSPEKLVQAFHDSVDDYLSFCAETNEEPEKPWSGKFVVRISPELHRLAAEAASKADQSLNAWVKLAMESSLAAPASMHMPQRYTPDLEKAKKPAKSHRSRVKHKAN
jgi:predicted HicB family RNase H-like nuclease